MFFQLPVPWVGVEIIDATIDVSGERWHVIVVRMFRDLWKTFSRFATSGCFIGRRWMQLSLRRVCVPELPKARLVVVGPAACSGVDNRILRECIGGVHM